MSLQKLSHTGPTRRGTTNSNVRGSAAHRRIRKLWLIATYGWPELQLVCCWLCDLVLDLETLTVDRHPVPGVDGGRYTRDNIKPACPFCNSSTGGKLGNLRRREASTC